MTQRSRIVIMHRAVQLLLLPKVKNKIFIKLLFISVSSINCYLFAYNSSSMELGDTVQVVLGKSDDTTPLYVQTTYYVNGFTGFRI